MSSTREYVRSLGKRDQGLTGFTLSPSARGNPDMEMSGAPTVLLSASRPSRRPDSTPMTQRFMSGEDAEVVGFIARVWTKIRCLCGSSTSSLGWGSSHLLASRFFPPSVVHVLLTSCFRPLAVLSGRGFAAVRDLRFLCVAFTARLRSSSVFRSRPLALLATRRGLSLPQGCAVVAGTLASSGVTRLDDSLAANRLLS